MSPDVLRAGLLVEARLGRPPQDALEAAVVLEAWAGVPAQQALETARALMSGQPAAPATSRAAPVAPSRPPRQLLEGFSFVVAVAAIALWAAPLAAVLGAGVVRDALILALPVTLGLQWGMVARHLGRPSGLAGLAEQRNTLALTAAALLFAAAVLGLTGALAALLIVTWTAGTVVIRRGWAVAYCAVVAGAVPAMLLGIPAPALVAGVAAVTAALAWWALATVPTAASRPGRWSRTLAAGLTGVGLGVLLVSDPTVDWADGAAPALALLPSALGALWAGRHLWSLAGAFPRALAGFPACAARDAVPRSVALGPARVLAGAAWRLTALTAVGSVALLPWLGTDLTGVLVGYGLIALATMLIGIMDALGRPSLGVAAVAASVACALAVRALDPAVAGAVLACGGAVAVLLLLPAALVLLARPARTLATSVWIT